MSELVTGEAVVLGLRPARLPSRGLAVAVDVAVAWAVYLGVSLLLLSATSSMDSAAVAAVSVATFVLVQVGIPIVIETLSHGRSLGKLVCGLRVVREDGGPIRFRHALVRGAMGAIEIVMTMGVVAAIASLVSARGRRMGDVFAGTLVIRERMPVAEAGTALPPPPPWLVAELGALDLSRVPDGWWLTVRQYLARMGQLDPQVGGTMAGRLAEDLRGFTGAPAPAGVHPVAYLAAVVGERQARETQRAFGAAAAGTSRFAGGGKPWGGEPVSSVQPVGVAGDVASSGTAGDVVASAPVGAWASPGSGASAGGGPARHDGGGALGAPVRERGGDEGGGGGGRPPRTGFAPPV
ncbi:RDD family protein [Streptomyces decoyicus]|uniref:RDD family protein n=2 Tax=Streptomyces decoyicus TaxID=249567 RepID=UPI001CA3A77B|nr:RDD family protein [Streptomyces decoyicus]QZY16299.1 RDD family protein [Streptomyces decoyicus]